MLQFMYRSSRPLDKGGPSLPKKFQFGLKIRGDGRSSPSLDPPLQIQTNKSQWFFKDKLQVLRTKIFLINPHSLTPFDHSIG